MTLLALHQIFKPDHSLNEMVEHVSVVVRSSAKNLEKVLIDLNDAPFWQCLLGDALFHTVPASDSWDRRATSLNAVKAAARFFAASGVRFRGLSVTTSRTVLFSPMAMETG